MTENLRVRGFRFTARTLTALCGAGSLAFMMMVGRHQKSVMLILMFAAWVSSPFVALLFMLRSPRWRGRSRAILLLLAVIMSSASVSVYGSIALSYSGAQPAKFFLMVPAASWVAIAVFALFARSSWRYQGCRVNDRTRGAIL